MSDMTDMAKNLVVIRPLGVVHTRVDLHSWKSRDNFSSRSRTRARTNVPTTKLQRHGSEVLRNVLPEFQFSPMPKVFLPRENI